MRWTNGSDINVEIKPAVIEQLLRRHLYHIGTEPVSGSGYCSKDSTSTQLLQLTIPTSR